MILVSAMYPNRPGSRFDRDCYLRTHIPLVQERWGGMGLQETRLVRGLGTADGGEAPFQVMALFRFRSLEDFQRAAQAHAQEILADVPKFTDVQPIIQIGREFG